MFAKLRIRLDTDQLDYKKSSNLQGVMFENVDPYYAEELHAMQMHPYSQFIEKSPDGTYWNIGTVTQEAYEQIILPILQNLDSFQVRGISDPIHITEKNLTTFSDQMIMNEFTTGGGEKSFYIDFLTPTAFRQNGRFIILPDMRLLFQNLMLRYSAVSQQMDMIDDETLSSMASSCFVVSHRIRSLRFPMERVFTPGFVGDIGIKCDGSDTLAGFVRLLLHFGEFAGVGVKTGMGMGGIRVSTERKRDE